MRLRDMGLKGKDLVIAAQEAGIAMTKQRASLIINGQAFIKPTEMEVIAKLLNRTIDELYIDLGSVLEVICPLLTAGTGNPFTCCRQSCAWWDWENQWCAIKNFPTPKKGDLHVD